MSRSRQRDSKQHSVDTLSLDCFLSIFLNPPSSPNFLLFIAKVSGEIMIIVTVSATESLILSGKSGCLGERAVQHL